MKSKRVAKAVTLWFEGDIKRIAIKNSFFRRVVYTGPHSQLALMSISAGDQTGEDKMEESDKILFIVKGKARSVLNGRRRDAAKHDVVFVPAGNRHNLVNSGRRDLKLIVVYSPPVYKDGTIHERSTDALVARNKQFEHAWEQ